MSLTSRTKDGFPARNFATFEHVKRRVDGGDTVPENVVLAHRSCNNKKNARDQVGVRHIDQMIASMCHSLRRNGCTMHVKIDGSFEVRRNGYVIYRSKGDD
jgi:hypothetical protein